MSDIEEAWDDFQSTPFPEGCAGLEVAGIELASLDTFAAGCIEAFVANSGRLNPDRLSVLRQCAVELGVVVKKLDGAAKGYFVRLQSLCERVLASLG